MRDVSEIAVHAAEGAERIAATGGQNMLSHLMWLVISAVVCLITAKLIERVILLIGKPWPTRRPLECRRGCSWVSGCHELRVTQHGVIELALEGGEVSRVKGLRSPLFGRSVGHLESEKEALWIGTVSMTFPDKQTVLVSILFTDGRQPEHRALNLKLAA